MANNQFIQKTNLKIQRELKLWHVIVQAAKQTEKITDVKIKFHLALVASLDAGID